MAPSFAISIAADCPRPEPAPVIKTTFDSKRLLMIHTPLLSGLTKNLSILDENRILKRHFIFICSPD
ncbi:phosphoglycerate kinase [Paenibacillus amylolyticus]|uniref:Phosphoglycerate kinase n=1 Tax=Paenibacillus amylolyticus TaxID=1451 RepID=A0A117I1E7_PAEAM|nr:phosphoglycerate kinase [Paenibacillus amylolyticus]